MPNDNRISAVITSQNKTAFLDALAAASAVLTFAINLTPEERTAIQSIGIERAGMIEAFSQAMAAHPELVPSYINMTETNKDVALAHDVAVLRAAVAGLLEKLDDTYKATTADLFVAFTSFYAIVKDARRRNVPGADSIYESLAPYFAQHKKKTSHTQSAPPPTT